MKIKNPLTPEERISLAYDMILRAKELEPQFGTVWFMAQYCALQFKIAEIKRERILS